MELIGETNTKMLAEGTEGLNIRNWSVGDLEMLPFINLSRLV